MEDHSLPLVSRLGTFPPFLFFVLYFVTDWDFSSFFDSWGGWFNWQRMTLDRIGRETETWMRRDFLFLVIDGGDYRDSYDFV